MKCCVGMVFMLNMLRMNIASVRETTAAERKTAFRYNESEEPKTRTH